jgi:tetratricopeptide (TPR) repeat protein
MKSMIRMASALLLAAAALALAGCSSPESKVDSFNKRGQALLQKGDLVKARLEFQNALQINPSTVPALYGLALIAEQTRDWPVAYQVLTKVVEIDPNHLDAHVKLGKLQLASGQLDKALASSDTALKLKPDSADVLGLRAAVLLKLSDPSAVAVANQALAKDPRHIDSLVVLASERLQAGDAERAVAFLDKALETNERNVSLQMLKVQALEKLSRTDKAEEVLRKLVTLFPDNTDYRYLLATFYVSHKQLDKAEAEYRSVVAAQSKAAAPKLELVRFLASARGTDVAAGELERMVKADPKAHDLKLAFAGLRLQQKNEAAAVALWKEIIADAGTDAIGTRARGALASYHLARKDPAAAKPLIEEMLTRDARDEQALLLRAGMAVDARRLDDAVGDLRTILRDTPQSARAQLMLARTHELQGLRDLATQHYANAAQAGQFAAAFAMPYAEYLMKTGRARQVEGVLREVLRVSPGYVPAQKLLAQSFLKTGNLAGAQAIADELAKKQAGTAVASQIQGVIQVARKDFSGGIASFKRAYELAPGDPQAMMTVVRGYMVANRSREALSFLQSVVTASPQNQTARVAQAQLLAQTGDTGAAVDALKKAIEINPSNPTPYQALANIHITARNAEAGMAAVEAGLKAIPADFGLRLSRASVLELQGKPEEAIAAYEALSKERPGAVVVANNLAALLADNRKDAASLQRAYDIAQRFRATDIPVMKDTVGWTTHLVGKPREAADLLKSAATGAPDLAVVHYHYGMNQLALKNTEVAKEALKRSIELAKASPFPQVDDARRTLQGL